MLDKLKTLFRAGAPDEPLSKASGDQLALLFDAPVDVRGYTTKRGTFVAPHHSRRKKAPDAPPAHDAHPQQTVEAARSAQVVDVRLVGVVRRPTGFYVVRPDGTAVQWFHFRDRAEKRAEKEDEARIVPAEHVNFVDDAPEAPAASEGTNPARPDLSNAQDAAPAELPAHLAEPTHAAPEKPAPLRGIFGADYTATPAQRKADNAAALELLQKADHEITPEDKAVLAKYSGRGGIGDSLNEYYTRPDVAEAMWGVLSRLGIPGGNVLEPSCGTGVFLHTAPEGIRVTGNELDATSGRIARLLHGDRHELATGSFEAFATTDVRLFDGVVGNPPFGLRGSFLAEDKKDIPRAEQYFLDTALDKTKEGGIVALVLPSGVMDASSARERRRDWLCKGEFLGALRMPNTAFAHSQTEVTTDVVFFRRRAPDVAQALLTLDDERLESLGVVDKEFIAGDYFEGRGAERVLGTMEAGWRAKAGLGEDITVTGSMDGVAQAIRDFEPHETTRVTMADVLDSVAGNEQLTDRVKRAALNPPYETAKVGDTKTVNGVVYTLMGDPPRWHRAEDLEQGEPDHVREARAMGERIHQFAQGQGGAGAIQQDLERWITQHGSPRSHPDIVSRAGGDAHLHRFMSAVQSDGSFSDLLTGARRGGEASVEATADRLSLQWAEGFTAAELARETDGDAEAIEDMLHASERYALEGGRWRSMDQYLTGELWKKLDAVREALKSDIDAATRAKLELQARRLEETIQPKSLEDVEIALNNAWIPLEVVQAFFNAQIAEYRAEHPGTTWLTDLSITFDKAAYTVKGGQYGMALLEKYLNRDGVRKEDLPTIERWNKDFKEWLCTSEHRDRVEDLYNRAYTGFVKPTYSEEPIEVPGLNPPFEVNKYHWKGLRWALANRKGIIAADVGVGKTPRGLMLARLMKLHGMAKKPAFVVPKSVLANWKAEAETWFPGSKVLIIGESYKTGKDGKVKALEDTKAVRDQKFHDLAQNDYDFVFLSMPVWNELDIDPETKKSYSDQEFWNQRADSLDKASNKRREKIRAGFEQSLAKREFDKRTEIINFNDLGIDALIMDEAHAYKNLYAARNRFGESPKFLGGSGQSNRALDTQYKARWVREKNGGNNVFFLTATPTKNSPLEVYSMLSHIAPEAFERMGIRNSEEFLDRFCEFKQAMTLGVDGQIEEALITSGFKNLDELREVMRRFIDRTTAAEIGLKLPTPDHQEHLVDMSPRQKAIYEGLRQEAETGENAQGDEVHIFSIMDRMAKAAMDLELLDPVAYRGETSPKYQSCAEKAIAGAQEGGQIIFVEHVDAHQKMKQALIERGASPDEIAIVNADEAPTSTSRQRVSDAFNTGKLKYVIGNRTMEEGMNLQKQTSDIHHLDIPWEPATLQQRNGRGLRQGNKNKAIRIHRYVAKGSFDGYRYQTVAAKKDWQDALWGNAKRLENLSAQAMLSREDMLIMLSADPDAARAKLASNKATATAKHEAAKRAEAAGEFIRFRELTRSARLVKNKASRSAARLSAALAASRARLESDPFFGAKDALSDPESALLHPKTGQAVKVGQALRVRVKDKNPLNLEAGEHVFVVTGVDPDSGKAKVRKYGDLSSTADLAVGKLPELEFAEYDAEAERRAIAGSQMGQKLEAVMRDFVATDEDRERAAGVVKVTRGMVESADAEWHKTPTGRAHMWTSLARAMKGAVPHVDEQRVHAALQALDLGMILSAYGKDVGTIRNEADLKGLPEAALHEHAETIQQHLKQLTRNYQDRRTDGGPMVGPDGKVKNFKSYEMRDKLEDHRFLLPTEADKRLAVDAWKEQQRSRRFRQNERREYRRGSSYRPPGSAPGVRTSFGDSFYQGTTEPHPLNSTVIALWGPDGLRDARAELEREAGDQALASQSVGGYVGAILPTLDPGYNGIVPWTPEHVRAMVAKAEAAGELGKPLREVLPKGIPAAVMDVDTNETGSQHTGDHTVGAALWRQARKHPGVLGDLVDKLANIPTRVAGAYERDLAAYRMR